jgi:4'-phosphopantetheinyl transferase
LKRLAEIIQWPIAPADPRLANSEVHVWAASLAVSPEVLRELSRNLAPDEMARAAKFRFELHRNRYIAGRGILRRILARYTSIDPAELAFDYSSNGKPTLRMAAALRTAPGSAPLHFNLAHSEDLAAFAITSAGPVGVDVEQVRQLKDMDHLVARFFSARENERFQQLAAINKPSAFFNLWTRKEALLKATGAGIAGGLNNVEVSFLEGEPARLLSIADDPSKAAGWFLHNLEAAAGFAGAVAVQGICDTVQCWRSDH